MKLTAVVAASDNDVIGRDNALPWHLPADLAHFKRVTLGKPMLMGRKTHESIGRPLPGRRNLVLSRNGFTAPGVETVATIQEACERVAGAPELMVIGGAEVFRLATVGIVFYAASMWVAGIMQGLMWREYGADGYLVYSFAESVAAMHPMYLIRATGGLLYLAGFLIMIVNVWATLAGRVRNEKPMTETPYNAAADRPLAPVPAA